MREYKNNQEPQIGDIVRFKSDVDSTLYTVKSVQGGRLGNKVCVAPVNSSDTFGREYYYYCFEVMDSVDQTLEVVKLEETFSAAATPLSLL